MWLIWFFFFIEGNSFNIFKPSILLISPLILLSNRGSLGQFGIVKRTSGSFKANQRFAQQQKNPLHQRCKGLVIKWQRPTLPGVTPVPSALLSLTALFGMGRGDPQRYRHHILFNTFSPFSDIYTRNYIPSMPVGALSSPYSL